MSSLSSENKMRSGDKIKQDSQFKQTGFWQGKCSCISQLIYSRHWQLAAPPTEFDSSNNISPSNTFLVFAMTRNCRRVEAKHHCQLITNTEVEFLVEFHNQNIISHENISLYRIQTKNVFSLLMTYLKYFLFFYSQVFFAEYILKDSRCIGFILNLSIRKTSIIVKFRP